MYADVCEHKSPIITKKEWRYKKQKQNKNNHNDNYKSHNDLIFVHNVSTMMFSSRFGWMKERNGSKLVAIANI